MIDTSEQTQLNQWSDHCDYVACMIDISNNNQIDDVTMLNMLSEISALLQHVIRRNCV